MKVAKLVKPGTIVIEEEKMPEICDDHDVLIKVKAVGICGTDLHIFEKGREDVVLPRILGHELSGEVVKIGRNVTRLRVGDHVVMDPVFSCGACRTCKRGQHNICEDVKCYGVQMDGGFREYVLTDEKRLFSFSSDVSWRQAVLSEPFSVGANIVSRAKITLDDNVVVIGSGTIGLCVAQAAKWTGARVLICDIADEKLMHAEKTGLDVSINSSKESLEEAVEMFSPGGADVVIDAVGTSKLMEYAISLTAPGARVIVIGFDNTPAKVSPIHITKKELMIIGSRMNNHRFPMVMKWLEEGKIRSDIMISAEYKFEDIQKAFEETLQNRNNIKTVVFM